MRLVLLNDVGRNRAGETFDLRSEAKQIASRRASGGQLVGVVGGLAPAVIHAEAMRLRGDALGSTLFLIAFLASRGRAGILDLGEISGNVELDLTIATAFSGTLVGNATFTITGQGHSGSVVVDLVQGGAGGFTIQYADSPAFAIVDPGGLAHTFVNMAPGSRSVGLWQAAGSNFYALGYDAAP